MGNGKFAMQRIPCACVAYTSILDKTWASGVAYYQQPLYRPVIDCTYWYVLDYFNKCNIVQFTNETKLKEDFEDIHNFLLDRISSNMVSLSQTMIPYCY